MTRGLPSAFTGASQAETLEPTWLLTVETGGTDLTYTVHDAAVAFAGVAYAVRNFSFEAYRQTIEENAGEVTVTVSDADGVAKALRQGGTDFRRRRATLRRVDRTLTAAGTHAQVDGLLVERLRIEADRVVFELATLSRLLDSVEIPLRKVTVEDVPGIVREP